jgi:hypothetical protein
MLLSQTIALLGHGMYDYPIISPQVGVLFFLSLIVIHTQYEKRCLTRPDWDTPKEMSKKPKPVVEEEKEELVISR